MTETLSPPGTDQSFWSIVGRAFWRSIQNRASALWLMLIVVLAVIVPFLANQSPYTAVIAGHREFPLFRNLDREDWIWLIWGIAALGFCFADWRIKRRKLEFEERRFRRVRAALCLLCAAAIVSGGVALLKSDYTDTRNYHQLTERGKIQDAVFPPLHWGFEDFEPLEKDRTFEYPSRDHWLGTDGNGRDALARLLWGVRVVFKIGLISEVISLIIGVVVGALTGYFAGTVDLLGMRLVEIVESIPTLLLLITFIAIFGRQLFLIMVIIGITSWTGIARFVRAEFFRIRGMDYVAAAKASGLPLRNILFRHMLPNGLTPVIVSFTFGVAGAISSESILSFLGIGVVTPTPSWGAMLNEAGNPAETFRWWLAIAPGAMIFFTVFACNIAGEGLRDAIDPRLNRLN